jgi:hypothetical protein
MSNPIRMFPSLPSTYLPELRREVCGRMFGKGIQQFREHIGLSVEEAARLSEMEFSEWAAIEAGGSLPQTADQLRAMAGALEMKFESLLSWAVVWRGAWEL